MIKLYAAITLLQEYWGFGIGTRMFEELIQIAGTKRNGNIELAKFLMER